MVRQNPIQSLRARGFLLQIYFATSNLLRISRAEFWELITDLVFGTPKTLAVLSYKYTWVPEKNINRKRTTCLNLPAVLPRTLLRPVRRRALAIGRASLRNLILSDPAPEERE
jgi:hypothetical protein